MERDKQEHESRNPSMLISGRRDALDVLGRGGDIEPTGDLKVMALFRKQGFLSRAAGGRTSGRPCHD